jgi:prepilin-type N-terminal cleavage/methylation domain-containing protein
MLKKRRASGFTLVEIMIVVVIIGLLAAMALPGFTKSRSRSQATAVVNNLRVYASAFEVYAMEIGTWPADHNRGIIPAGMEGQLPHFSEETHVGGYYDWDPGVFGYTAAVSIVGVNAGPSVLQAVDEILDDGNPGSGMVVINGNRLSYILEP